MLSKIKNIFLKADRFLYKKFGSEKSTKVLENIKEAKLIFSYLNDFGKESQVRFVGGCVRKALSGEEIDDIDLATSINPNDVKIKLEKNGVRVIDTGLSHGTLTAILNKKKFEITTLRKDVKTDGRHANVEFTESWEEDSKRRDFTINAIYSDIEGRIFDPQNGISDLKNGKIKFIGSVEERIQEDYLRILRYFRFFTNYSKIEHDNYTIGLIRQNINGLNKISNERKFDELKKIIKLENLYSLFSNNSSREIIINIFPQFKYYERLKIFNKLNLTLKRKYNSDLILALLIVDQSKEHEYFCHKYKTSNKIKDKFKNISNYFDDLNTKNFYSEQNVKKLIYLLNKEHVKGFLLFSLCVFKKITISDIYRLIDYVDAFKIPKFPISGNFLKEHGYEAGELLGTKLKRLEETWIKENFTLKDETLKKILNKKKN